MNEPEDGLDDAEWCGPPQISFPRKALAYLVGMVVMAAILYAWNNLFGV